MAKAKSKPAPIPDEDDEDGEGEASESRTWTFRLSWRSWLRKGAYLLTALLFGTATAGWFLPDLPIAGPLVQPLRARLWASSKATPKKTEAKKTKSSKAQSESADASDAQPSVAPSDRSEPSTEPPSDDLSPDIAADAPPLADDPAEFDEVAEAAEVEVTPKSTDAANDTTASLPSRRSKAPAARSFDESSSVAAIPSRPVAASPALEESASDTDPSLTNALADDQESAPSPVASTPSTPASDSRARRTGSRWSRQPADEAASSAATEPESEAQSETTTVRDATSPPSVAALPETSIAPAPSAPSTRAAASPNPSARPFARRSDPRLDASSDQVDPVAKPAAMRAMSPGAASGSLAAHPSTPSAGSATTTAPVTSGRSNDVPFTTNSGGETISIATFNIQVFGTAKLETPEVADRLAEIIRQFDLVAIQEIRSKDDSLLPRFIRLINSKGRQYEYVIGPRLGRSSSKEQYAFIYDAQRVEVNRPSVGTIEDPNDLLHREPLIARFRSRLVPPDRAFTFYLANVHTDPDDVENEVDVLADVFEVMQRTPSGEDDVILLGDFNTDYRKLGRLGERPNIFAVVENTPTNTRQNQAYDNLVFDRQATAEFTGKWAVLDVQSWFRLTAEEASSISDHLPVWATFSAWEAPRGPGDPNRAASSANRATFRSRN